MSNPATTLRLVVVLPLHPLEGGAGFTLREWPLHLTLAPTFTTTDDLAATEAAVAPLLTSRSTILVRAGREEGFGRSMSRPASVVDASPELIGLHLALVAALMATGAEFDHPEFTGTGYRPHITRTRVAGATAGDLLELRQAAIVDMAPAGDQRLRRVVWTADLE